jgi:hypothetical protein
VAALLELVEEAAPEVAAQSAARPGMEESRLATAESRRGTSPSSDIGDRRREDAARRSDQVKTFNRMSAARHAMRQSRASAGTVAAAARRPR